MALEHVPLKWIDQKYPNILKTYLNKTSSFINKANHYKKYLISFLVLLVLVAGLWVSSRLVRQKQTITGRAATPTTSTYDVVVVGGGAGGVSAAIQARRMGSSVAILEETDWIGGQMTAAAVSTMDEGQFFKQGGRSGIYKELVDKVRNYYSARGKTIGTCYWSDNSVCFEPSVGQSILNDMLKQAGVQVFLRERVDKVLISDNKITGVITQHGSTFNSKVLIEATEYGDILSLTPARYRAGNSINTALNPNACVQDITYAAVMKRYPNGVPSDLAMRNKPVPVLYDQVVNEFRKIVINSGKSGWNGTTPVDWPTHNAYRGLPDSSGSQNYSAGNPNDYAKISKTVINWANDYPYKVSNLTRSERKKVNCEAKLKTLQFIYYVQNELGKKDWSIANDQGFDTAYNKEENDCPNIPTEFKAIERHFPVMLYIREGRRAIGSTTLTAGNIKRTPAGNPPSVYPRAAKTFVSSLAVGDYPIDLHGCKGSGDLESSLESLSDVPEGFIGGPFQIPFEVFVPESLNGLVLAEKNLSATRLANGAIRLQPIAMLTGQSAGAIATIAVQDGVQPRQVNVGKVQNILLDSGVMLYGFTDIPLNHPHFKNIQKIALRGVMSGYGNSWNFGPNKTLTRAEVAVVLTNTFSLTKPDPNTRTPRFKDVPKSHWAFTFVEALVDAGMTAGYPDGTYKPDNQVTRAEMAVFMTRGIKVSPTPCTSKPFPDVETTHWACSFIKTVKEKNIMQGYGDGSFKKDQAITRGETAITSFNALVFLGLIK